MCPTSRPDQCQGQEVTTGTGAAQPLPDRVRVAPRGLLNQIAGAHGQAGIPRQK